MELQPLDYVLAAVAGLLVIVGLFKGLSGWLGTIAGVAVASVAGTMGFGVCRMAAEACSFVTPPMVMPAATVLDFLGALIVFGIVRRMVVKFVNFLVPQPLNALLGAAGGAFVAMVIAGVLAATAMFEGCAPTEGFMAGHSEIVRIAAGALSAVLGGEAQ